MDLHFSSGMDLLLFLCETDLPEIDEVDDNNPVSTTYITAFPRNISLPQKAYVTDKLRRSFGIPSTTLPCIIFFSGPQAKVSYLLPLGQDKRLYRRRFSLVYDAAHAVAEESPPPFGADPAAYVQWREDSLVRLKPRLNFERLIQAATNLPFIQLVTLAAKGIHGS